jgi:hypothetical protein
VSAPQQCLAYPQFVSTDAAGNIWVQSTAPSGVFGEIKASDYDHRRMKP